MATAESDHALLELAASTGAAGCVLGEYSGQPRGARAAPRRLQAAQVEAQIGGLVESALEFAIRDDGGEVQERAGRGGDRDAVPRGDLLVFQRRTVHDHQPPDLAAARRRDRHVDPRAAPRQQAPEKGRAPVAQDPSVADSKDSSQEMAVSAERRASHRVHAPVNPVQPAGADPPLDRAVAQAHSVQLSPRDDAVLAPAERRRPNAGRKLVDFLTHTDRKSTRFAIRPRRQRVPSTAECPPSETLVCLSPRWPR